MSTLEILIALSIFTVSITSVVMVAFGNQSAIVDTEINRTALSLAQEMLEGARVAARNDWDSAVSTSTVAESFTKNIEVSDADDFLKSIVSKVTWQLAGHTYDVELATLIEDVNGATAQGTCAVAPLGDWANPTVASTIDLGTTGSVTGVDVKEGIAYVTADGDGTLPDFFAVDVATSSPHVLWSLDTGPGLNAVHVADNYAYVATQSVTKQLQVIDLNARTIQNYKLPGSGAGDTANNLYYYNHRVYLGTPKSANKEFFIIDVSNPSSPNEIGSWEFNVGVNDIYVSNGVAYVATPDAEELKMLDVHDPTHITSLGGYDAAGKSGDGKSIARAAQRLYLGRTAGNDELYSLDINDIYNGAVARGNVGNSSVDSIIAMGDILFLATKDVTKDFQVWRTTSDTSKLSYVSSLDLPDQATSVDCEGQTVYLTTNNSHRGLLVLKSPS